MIRRARLWLAVLLSLTLASFAGYWLWDHRGYWLADNFRAAVPGRIYAGGYQYPWPLERIIRRHGIKTVLSLREGGDSFEFQERAVLEANGVQFQKIVIPYKVSDEQRIAAIERAIDFLTDERNQPIYVHCWAGCHRTGAVMAIYRVSRCNWSEQDARDELVSWGGTALGTEWPKRVLHAYCSRPRESLATQQDFPPLR